MTKANCTTTQGGVTAYFVTLLCDASGAVALPDGSHSAWSGGRQARKTGEGLFAVRRDPLPASRLKGGEDC
jgi:hypothetical protein